MLFHQIFIGFLQTVNKISYTGKPSRVLRFADEVDLFISFEKKVLYSNT